MHVDIELVPRPLELRMAHYKGAASEGNRAAQLMKKREKAKEELEKLKQKIAEVCTTGGGETEKGGGRRLEREWVVGCHRYQ